jgi:hypothetical protein
MARGGRIEAMPGKRLQELRSLEYHRAVADRLRVEPRLLETARERVQKWRDGGQLHPHYAAAWQEAFARPFEDLLAFLVEDSEAARSLRHVSPFAGFVGYRERLRIWREVKARHAS